MCWFPMDCHDHAGPAFQQAAAFNMAHALDGARLKVVRAQEHLDSLKAEIRMYLDADPYHFPAQQQGDRWTVRAELKTAPPIRFSTIIGDCVVNARAALDYIVWQLALKYLTPPVDLTKREDRRITAFPLFDAPAQGLNDRLNRLTNRSIPAAALAEIQTCQPYNAGYEPLWWLHELANDDKHRLPLLTVTRMSNSEFRVFRRAQGTVTPIGGAAGGAVSISFRDQTFPATGPTGDDGMEVYGQASGFVAFEQVAMPREPVERTLEQIVETVTHIIPRFDGFF